MKLKILPPLNFIDDGSLQRHDLIKLKQFVDEANQDISKLNRMIKEYNSTKQTPSRVELLGNIYQTHQQMRFQYPPLLTARCPGYEEQHQFLFKSIQDEFHSLGVNSLPDVLLQEANVSEPTKPAPLLATIVATMPPEKLNHMIRSMLQSVSQQSQWNPAELQLFSPHEPGYQTFNEFLSTHSCQFKSMGNSINFQITDGEGQHYLLKTEVNRESALQLEMDLRATSLGTALVTAYAERNAQITEGPHAKSGAVWVSGWCEKGNLLSESARHQDSDKIRSAIEIYKQMGEILHKMEQEGCFFCDMKNENWLLNDKGQVRISDAKSLLHTSKHEIKLFDFQYAQEYKGDEKNNPNRWHDLVYTRHLTPPEFNTKKERGTWTTPVMDSPAHAYMLGKNLYQYLTGCDNAYLVGKKSADAFDFSDPIFQTSEGQRLQTIIKDTVREDPARRMWVSRVVNQLEQMQSKEEQQCYQLLKDINQCRIGRYDPSMDRFLDTMQRDIIAAANGNDQERLQAIQKNLVEACEKLVPATQMMRDTLDSLRETKRVFSFQGREEKASQIEAAIAHVPIEERPSLHEGLSTQAQNVLQLMATHRSPGKGLNLQSGTIDEKKAARTFTEFKEKMQAFKQDLEKKEIIVNSADPSGPQLK